MAQKRVYLTSGCEFIFSFANLDSAGSADDFDNIVRFTAFINSQNHLHWDFSRFLGLYSGLDLRNVGFIYERNDINNLKGTDVLHKFRAYSLGIPLALKIGDRDKSSFFYAGGEVEWMFHFKHKTFENGTKTIQSKWFSDEVNTFIPSVFVGYEFSKFLNIKFKYYLGDFLNTQYSYMVGNTVVKPYEGWTTQMYYFSLSYNLRTKKKNNFQIGEPTKYSFYNY